MLDAATPPTPAHLDLDVAVDLSDQARAAWAEAAVAGPAIAVVDGHPAHRAKATAAFVAEHTDRLAVRFQPGYSPHLNPDEWVWKNLKHNVFGRLAPRSLAEMKTAITAGVHRPHENSGIVRGFFSDPDLAYVTQADQQVHSKSTTRVRA